jgi:glucosamine--fructose-6-phosphate aminotransferase (isomerizing)
MCGIVGYLGKRNPVPLLFESLKKLEYRGYDSSGIAYVNGKADIHAFKASGKLVNLQNQIPADLINPYGNEASTTSQHIGIGHIRWATHGAATDVNAHPHISGDGTIALVHNGIIENYHTLKMHLAAKGHVFSSETDTECVAHLLEDLAHQAPKADFLTVLQQAMHQLEGAYAFAIFSTKFPNRLYAVRNHAPLIIGVGKDGEYWVASDTVAIAEYTNQVIYLKDNEVVELTPDGIKMLALDGTAITPKIEQVNTTPLQIDKKGYRHFMLKEIHEQSDVVRNALMGRLLGDHAPIQLIADNNDTLVQKLKTAQRIQIIACGTSFHAGLIGKYFFEDLGRVPVEVEVAGEYRYRRVIVDNTTLVIAISQSGETADTLEAIRQAKAQGATIVTVTNREDASMARESDFVVPVRAGIEVSVAATKSFLAQLVVLYLLGLMLAEARQSAPTEQIAALKSELLKIPVLIDSAVSEPEPLQAMAKKYGHSQSIIYMGRGVNFPVALEGALKLKEISYIHAEGYSASELKHGPIAILDDKIPVVAVLVPGERFEKMISNCQEVKARDSQVIGVGTVDLSDRVPDTFDDVVCVPQTSEYFSPLITIIPLQFLAYYIAEHLGKDVDQPRNLAKSVTVE